MCDLCRRLVSRFNITFMYFSLPVSYTCSYLIDRHEHIFWVIMNQRLNTYKSTHIQMYAEYEELEVSVVDMTDVHMLSLDTPHPYLGLHFGGLQYNLIMHCDLMHMSTMLSVTCDILRSDH